jgi:UDP-glucose 4-epimerase
MRRTGMILITGGLGFLGSGLARYLVDQGEEVLLTRRRNARIPATLANDLDTRLKVVDCDILDLPSLIAAVKKYHVTSIIHAAVAILAKASLYQAVKINMEGTANVLEAARLSDIKRVTFTSSNTVYMGIQEKTLCKENTPIPLDVNHPIASEKIACEALCNLYAHEYGLEVMITRPSMIYGPGSFSIIAPLPLMVEQVLKQKSVVISQFHPDWGVDFVYIKDCARAIGMVHVAKGPKYRLYNTASGRSYTLRDVAALIQKVIPDCHIELRGLVPPGTVHAVDISRLRDEFGYAPEYDLERGVREYIGWVVKGKP